MIRGRWHLALKQVGKGSQSLLCFYYIIQRTIFFPFGNSYFFRLSFFFDFDTRKVLFFFQNLRLNKKLSKGLNEAFPQSNPSSCSGFVHDSPRQCVYLHIFSREKSKNKSIWQFVDNFYYKTPLSTIESKVAEE